jgi:betaine reductase
MVSSRQILAHVPDLVFSGSKPAREIVEDPTLHDRIAESLQSYEDACAYLPNQVFVGAAAPSPLIDSERPWWNRPGAPSTKGRHGRIFDQPTFLSALSRLDAIGLTTFPDSTLEGADEIEQLEAVVGVARKGSHGTSGQIEVLGRDGPIGFVEHGYPNDDSLAAPVVLENLAAKTTAALALADSLASAELDSGAIDLVISCSEEAVGDRYQRGGGNLGKAIAEAVGAVNASGFDVKNFCAAPIPALVVASSLISSGVVSIVAVVAGGSLPKLGMKFEGHLRAEMPILEDCLGGFACILSNQGEGPSIRHDAVGRHSVGAGGSNQAIFQQLVIDPLESAGLKVTDVDLFGTEMHNPEITEPQGSGNVPLRNYRMIAALAARSHHIASEDIDAFLRDRCVSGYAPTQGHLASAICLLPLGIERLQHDITRLLLAAKGSLFLGKMSGLSDGMSVIIEN